MMIIIMIIIIKTNKKTKGRNEEKKMYLCFFLGKHIGNVFIFKIFIAIDICNRIIDSIVNRF